jgi:hypothetical protein
MKQKATFLEFLRSGALTRDDVGYGSALLALAALEGFAATFLEPEAARVAMRARLVEDSRISGTTEGRIEEFIADAARLRGWYGVPTGYQRALFFQSFVVVSVEPSRNQVRILPYTASGRMTWAELQHSPGFGDQKGDEEVEFVFPLSTSDQQ